MRKKNAGNEILEKKLEIKRHPNIGKAKKLPLNNIDSSEHI